MVFGGLCGWGRIFLQRYPGGSGGGGSYVVQVWAGQHGWDKYMQINAYHCDFVRKLTERLKSWEVLVRRLGTTLNKWTHPSLVKDVFWFYSCQVAEQGRVNDGWIEHCSQLYNDKDHDNKQVGQNVKNAEKGVKHGHLRVTMGQGNGGRGAVVYDDELLSAS